MADYYNPSVIWPAIPMADMTMCERLLLTGMFEHDIDDDAETISFHTWTGVNDMPEFERDEVEQVLNIDDGFETNAHRLLTEAMAHAGNGGEVICPDLSTTSYEGLLQDIIKRSTHLNYITVETSFMCSKMRLDGFGGMAVLITADRILGKSTNDLLQDFLKEVDPDGRFDQGA
ncbi:hypothetical protein [Asticcacaulis sp.]|uniref:hypothetical protein n=1 Tax=Asticcacaulis sp. TaxID=1872648 RepID=UPI002CDBBE5E|nr:hypothetical protein [Asticcacaulis sp.]HTM82181.1 hypothetical protein [Asticcacaulis sp.]